LSGSKTDPETDKWFSGSVFASGYSHIKKYDIMSVSEREQTKFVHRERRMAIMIAAKAASSTAGANHDIMSVSEWEQTKFVHRKRFKSKRNQAGETGKWDRNYIWNVIRESAEI